MAERDLTRSGVQVDFFGEPTRMPAGPARLAIETGAALLPAALAGTRSDGWGLSLSARRWTLVGRRRRHHPGAGRPVRRATSPPTPQDWHMLQPQWLADLSDERRARLLAGSP